MEDHKTINGDVIQIGTRVFWVSNDINTSIRGAVVSSFFHGHPMFVDDHGNEDWVPTDQDLHTQPIL